jgi:hypothetical protein
VDELNGCAALMWIVVNIRVKALELLNSNVKTSNMCPDKDRHIDRQTDGQRQQADVVICYIVICYTVICCPPRVILVYFSCCEKSCACCFKNWTWK